MAPVCWRGGAPGARELGTGLSPLGTESCLSLAQGSSSQAFSTSKPPGELPEVLMPVFHPQRMLSFVWVVAHWNFLRTAPTTQAPDDSNVQTSSGATGLADPGRGLWKPRTLLGGSLPSHFLWVLGPHGRDLAREARPLPGHLLPQPGKGGLQGTLDAEEGTAGNPRGSFGGKWKPSQQEGGCVEGGGLEASDQGWDPDAQLPVTRKGRPAGFGTGTTRAQVWAQSAGRGRLALSGAPCHP